MGRDVATVFVVASIALILAVMAYVSSTHPRTRDDERPDELSRLGPPFPSPTNGVRKC